ncbi:DUF4244 domain-containing protein [Salinithrix halophila]|uniref:DUF4244 domain-containing protein n=1 Tax=Salinithrix halophila TaxID=1485204 RepID=A0ABV8JCN1_9BACL
MEKFYPYIRLLKSRRGSSTLEYILILVGASLLAAVLYGVLSSGETKSTLEAVIRSAFSLEAKTDKKESQNNQDISSKAEADNASPKKEDPGPLDKTLNFLKRKGSYVKDQAGKSWDYYTDKAKEEWDYATSDPIGWWFWDDLSSGLTGKDNKTGEELGFLESLDRTVEGIPIGIGKGWRYGKTGVKELFRIGKKSDDFVEGLVCAKKKGKGCKNKNKEKDKPKDPKRPKKITFSSESNKHVEDRHVNKNKWTHKSKWTVSGGDWRTYSRDTFRKPDRVTQDGDRFIYEKEYKQPLGVDPNGEKLYKVRVVVEKDGEVVTAFPQKDWK